MNFYSIGISFGTAACLSMAIGMLFRYASPTWRSFGPTLSIALSMAVSIPILLSGGFEDLVRAIRPREAIDWVPVGVLTFALLERLSLATTRRQRLWMIVAACIGCLFAVRLLYGGVHLRAGVWQWTGFAWSLAWGLSLWTCWFPDFKKPSMFPWLEGTTRLILTACVAVALASSGSLVYGAVAGLLFISIASSWIGNGSLGTFSSSILIVLIGLGVAYSELKIAEAFVLAGSVLLVSISRWSSSKNLSKNLSRGLLAVAAGLALSCATARVIQVTSAESRSTDSNGYDSYK
jgi:hypothetical protein